MSRTTIKLKFRPSTVAKAAGTLYYQVIRHRVVRQINSGQTLMPEYWDNDNGRIAHAACADKQTDSVSRRISNDMKRLNSIVAALDRSGADYTADTVVGRFLQDGHDGCFLHFAHTLVATLAAVGRKRTAQTYAKAIASMEKFLGDSDIPLEDFDSMTVAGYDTFLRSRGLCANTVAYYMRNLRAIYNRAAEQGLTEQHFPFRHVNTAIDSTVKRALPLAAIRRIKAADLSGKRNTELARDLFLFSFYTRGMSFVDLAFLRKTDVSAGVLTYRRRKTGQQLCVKWEKCMQEIVDRYDTSGSEYLLPIITNLSEEPWAQYNKVSHLVNVNLKKLGRQLGLKSPLTMYVARHSWASAAQGKNIPLSIISRSMGHDSEKTTRIYLASLDTAAIDNANRRILKSIGSSDV